MARASTDQAPRGGDADEEVYESLLANTWVANTKRATIEGPSVGSQ